MPEALTKVVSCKHAETAEAFLAWVCQGFEQGYSLAHAHVQTSRPVPPLTEQQAARRCHDGHHNHEPGDSSLVLRSATCASGHGLEAGRVWKLEPAAT